MADNIALINPSSGTVGNTVATDEIASVHHQLVKLEYGADSSATMVSASNPLPIVVRNSSGTEIGTSGNPIRIDPTGTTAQPVNFASTPTMTLSGTGAVNIAQYSGSAVGAANALHVQPGAGAVFLGGFTGAQAVTVSGSVSTVGGFSAAQPVTVSGSVTTLGGFTGAQPVTVSDAVAVGYSAMPTILIGGYTATPTVALSSSTVLGVGFSSAQTLGVGFSSGQTIAVGYTSGAALGVGFTSGAVLGVGFTSTPTVTTNPHIVGVSSGTMAVGYSAASVLGVGASSATGIVTQGAAASGASVAGNPIYNGGRAANTNPTAAADGQAVGLMADPSGKLVNKIGAVREMFTQGETTLTNTSETTLIASAGASLYWDIDKLIIDNTGTVGATITLRDQTGGGNAYHFNVPCTAGPCGFSNPIPLHQATANRSWSVQSDTSVSSIYVKFSASKNQ